MYAGLCEMECKAASMSKFRKEQEIVVITVKIK